MVRTMGYLLESHGSVCFVIYFTSQENQMKRGGTAIWKMQVFLWLFLLSFFVLYLLLSQVKEKRNNYQALWNKVAELERRCR